MTQFWPEGRLIRTEANRRALGSRAALEEACRRETLLEALALRCDPEHRLHLSLNGLPGIIPREECALGIREGRTRDIAILTCVGKPVSFVVTGFSGDTVLLSRRRAQELALRELLRTRPGEILPAAVTHLEPYGAFVDLGCGVPSLVPLKAISVSRIPHPACRFRPGQEIFVLVRGTRPEQGRVLLSHRELLGTWAENAARFLPGETVPGVVRGVMDYGIFVELAPNLTGLAEPREGFQPGDAVSVFIKSIQPEKRKLKLVLIGRTEPLSPPMEYFHTRGRIPAWSYEDPETEVLPAAQEEESP